MKIDWNFILTSFNNVKKTKFKSHAKLLSYLYFKHHNLEKMEEVLGVSARTLAKEMDSLQIPRKHKRLESEIKIYLLSQSPERLSNMTIHDLQKETNAHVSELYKFLCRLNLKYKNLHKVPQRR